MSPVRHLSHKVLNKMSSSVPLGYNHPLLYHHPLKSWASLVAQTVKNPPAMRQTWDRSLGWEDPLGRGMATTPVTLPGEFHGQRSLVGYSPSGHKESDTTKRLTLPLCEVYGILIPQPGLEPEPSAVKVRSLNHQITREFPILIIF